MDKLNFRIISENAIDAMDLSHIMGGQSNPIDPNCFLNFCKCNKEFECGSNTSTCTKDNTVCGIDTIPACPYYEVACDEDAPICYYV